MYLSQANNVTFAEADLSCPAASQFVDSVGGLYGLNAYAVVSNLCDGRYGYGGDSVLVSTLLFSCDACPSGFYSVFAGKSTGAPGQAVNYPCLPCPSGAQCTGGGVVLAMQDRWGDQNASGIVTFVQCPAGYCNPATGNESLSKPGGVHLPGGVKNACAGHRSGLLCSDCVAPGYVEALGSTECVPTASCAADKAEVWPLILLALLGSAVCLLAFVSGVWAAETKPPGATVKLALYFFQVSGGLDNW